MPQDSRQSREQAINSRRAAEIGTLPDVVDRQRKEFCRLDLLGFLTVYFPETTGLNEFSDEHKGAILRMQIAILEGGSRVLNLFPRGFAKTTISENAALWAILYGHRKFIPIIGADETSARNNMESIKTEMLTNSLLFDDFPESIAAVMHLENKSQRCRSQTHHGELTHMEWGMTTLVLPSIRLENKWTPSSGGIVVARGLTGRLRGMAHKRPDGTKQRPDFIIIDDPQTDMTARSPSQCATRLSLISQGVLRLGGHRQSLSTVMNATVIREDDAADQLADHIAHPEWEGLRIPMMKSDATAHDTLWMEDYSELRRTYDAEDPHARKRAIARSHAFYTENREAMDAGAEATWASCFGNDEISAIQHAYNIRIDDGEVAFASECQNQPIRMGDNSEFLTASEVNRDRVGTWVDFPAEVTAIGFHIDVMKRALYWTVIGVTDDFRLFPVYGTYPEQRQKSFDYRTIRKSIQQTHRGLSEERAVQKAIEMLLDDLCNRSWKRQDGVELGFDIGLVDGGYQIGSVKTAILNSGFARRVFPLFGRGVKAGDVPMLQRQKKKNELRSTDGAIPWTLAADKSVKGIRTAFNDTNATKTFLHRRLATDAGRGGSFELPKGDHRRYCEHLASSEYSTETSGPHGTCTEWRMMPGQPDNHWLDTTCGAIIAASISGKVAFNRAAQTQAPKRQRKVSYL